MRLQPIGRDQQGLMYWLQLDQEQNIRLYTEEQDDLDGSTWKCIVRTRNDLAEALELLKAQIESHPCQDQDQTQIPAGSRSTSPAENDTGMIFFFGGGQIVLSEVGGKILKMLVFIVSL